MKIGVYFAVGLAAVGVPLGVAEAWAGTGDEPPAVESGETSPEPGSDEPQATETDEITVWGEGRRETNYVSPDSILLPQDLASVTAVTTEDLIKYEPSIIIRRRFIGDANGTIGMRGSNMFQTTRTMVFADGIPLHYFLRPGLVALPVGDSSTPTNWVSSKWCTAPSQPNTAATPWAEW